jgi:hypothetical protein
VGANAAPANVSHSAGETNGSTESSAPAGSPGSQGSTSTPKGGSGDVTQPHGPAANPGGSQGNAEQAAKNAAKSGADDSVLLAVLVLGFAVAVSGVVIVAGRRGGRRAG